jgi:hypothetical protein
MSVRSLDAFKPFRDNLISLELIVEHNAIVNNVEHFQKVKKKQKF